MKVFSILKKVIKARRVPQSKSLLHIIYEFIYYKITQPAAAEHYFSSYLFLEKNTDLSGFILTNEIIKQCWDSNNQIYKSILFNKHFSELFFNQRNVQFVKSIAWSHNSLFFKKDELIHINTYNQFVDFLSTLKHDGVWEEDSLIIKKKDDSWGGKGIFKLFYHDLQKNHEKIKIIFDQVIQSGFLYQNTLKQHPDLQMINPHSINTVRINTFTSQNGVSSFLSAYLRSATNDSFLDNISVGGLFVGLDNDTGMLHEEAFTDFDHGTGRVFKNHPVTGTAFKGYSIPFYKDANHLALKAAQCLPHLRLIAWDIAILPDGPIIIEGNFWPDLQISEAIQKGFKNHPVMDEILKEIYTHK